ncbi:MAG TPA: ABC transporter permease [Cyclobacteriaceae bacterium]|nr:ABC transporter permease [Cyclobacteriaceae bacterium]
MRALSTFHRQLSILLRKEFKQIFRDRAIVAIIFIMPTVQFLILPLAANFEFKNINLVLVDHDHSSYSHQLTSKIFGSNYFQLVANCNTFDEAYHFIEKDQAGLILEIPSGFERNLVRENSQKVFLAVNAINGSKANLGGNYLSSIIADFNREISIELTNPAMKSFGGINVTVTPWFNPSENYKLFIVPGILALLVTIVGGFLSALNIVREKEIGTIEQINVTPISKVQFVLGKLIPFWILANIVFSIGLLLGYLIYHITPQGSLLVLYAFVSVYLLALLGFGLLISTFCQTQQQAMFFMFFFMIIFILLGGLFTPIDSMPDWAKWIVKFNPVAYMIDVMRMVILKGSGMKDVLPQLGAISLIALVLNSLAVWNYRKTS